MARDGRGNTNREQQPSGSEVQVDRFLRAKTGQTCSSQTAGSPVRLGEVEGAERCFPFLSLLTPTAFSTERKPKVYERGLRPGQTQTQSLREEPKTWSNSNQKFT